MPVEWVGIFPALTTKFSLDDTLDLQAFVKNIEYQVDAGVNGIILSGTLGEGAVLSEIEKEMLCRVAVEKTPGPFPVILSIAESSTREALSKIKKSAEWGVNGFMVLPPMRYKCDPEETITWFRTIGDNTDLPIMVYNNPVDYKNEVTIRMFEKLSNCNNIKAVKESTRDVSNVTRMRSAFGDRFRILCGVDTLALEELCSGADGWVAGLVNAFPRETIALYRMVCEGKLKEAQKLYKWFMPLLELDIHPKLVQYIKMAEAETGLGTEYVRMPRLPVAGEERERILKIIRDAINTRPPIDK